jgi:hypothetical protein
VTPQTIHWNHQYLQFFLCIHQFAISLIVCGYKN